MTRVSVSETLTRFQAENLRLTPQALVDSATLAAGAPGVSVTALVVTGVVSVLSSVTIFAVVLLGLRARDRRLEARDSAPPRDGDVTTIPKWSASAGTVRSLSSLSRLNPAFDEDSYSMSSTNTDTSKP